MKHVSTTAPRELRARSFAWTLLLGVAALTIALAGMRSIGDIIGPVFMAVVITITLHPIRLWLERGRLPGWATSLLMLASAVLLLSVFAVALMVSVAQLAALVPTYADQIADVASFCFLTTALAGQVAATDPGMLGRRVRGD